MKRLRDTSRKTENRTMKQLRRFLGIGLFQYVLDVFLFFVLFSVFQYSVLVNFASRAVAAVAGYYLNGLFTFRVGSEVRSGYRKANFLVLWSLLTVLSTLLLALVKFLAERNGWNLEVIALAKPMVEAILFLLSFVLQKHWVFRHADST